MNILVICSYFPPDLSIAAIRPYMFSKYLVEFGHNVTVLCSKKTSNNLKDTLYNPNSIGTNIVYYDAKDDYIVKNISPNREKFHFLTGPIYNLLAKIYHKLFYFYYYKKNYQTFDIEKKKKIFAIDNMQINQFDIVIATFPNLEDLYAGVYAKDKFNSKLIIDFRDLIVGSSLENWYNNKYMLKYEKELVDNGDYIICVSNDISKEIKHRYGINNIEVINNGYDEFENFNIQKNNDKAFHICYTGGLKLDYQQRMIGVLFNVLNKLIKGNCIDKNLIEFKYAGSDSKIFNEIIKKYKLLDIAKDYGVLTRKDVYALQNKSDLFVVPSINTKKIKGIISGKFYEGIRTKKVILSLVDGDMPNSELYQMNVKYKYGFCYEHAKHNVDISKLEKFIQHIYNYKVEYGYAENYISDKIYNDFSYKNLTKKLEQVCMDLISN